MASDMASPNRHGHASRGNSDAAAAEAPPPLPNNVATPRHGISSDLSLPHDDRRIISPSTADTAPPRPGVDVEDFPSMHICPIVGEPPVDAVTFLDSPQAFEYSAIFRFIAIRGTLLAVRNITHPISQQTIRRDQALAQIRRFLVEIQDSMTQQHIRIRLSPGDVSPITQVDHDRYNETIQVVQNR